jgi:protein gp37
VSDIEWTDRTWNPLVGCTRVSPGCEHCYAERFVHRQLSPQHRGLTVLGKGEKGPRWTGEVRLVESALGKPLSWRKPQRVFVNSLSDLWHENVSNETVARIFAIMAGAPHITFQILTKRPERMREWFRWIATAPAWRTDGRHDPLAYLCGTISEESAPLPAWVGEEGEALFAKMADAEWPLANVWLGVTAEDQQRADERIPLLLDTPAAVRFVSYEPALGPVNFGPWMGLECTHEDAYTESDTNATICKRCDDAAHLDWLIVGGESGHGARPFDVAWARSAVEQCQEAGTACFVKQLGAQPRAHIFKRPLTHDEFGSSAFDVPLKSGKGNDPAEWPRDLRVREFPR